MAIETTSDLSLVGTSQIVDGSVTSAKIGTGAVGSAAISAASVGTAAISSGAATSGQILQANGSGAVTFATATSGGLTLIATATPSAATSLAFSSIPGTYKHLQLIWFDVFQSTAAAWWGIRLNNDSTVGQYHYRNHGTGSSVTSTATMIGTTNQFAPIGANTTSSTAYSLQTKGILNIYRYTESANKFFTSDSSNDPTDLYADLRGVYIGAAAITSIDFVRSSTQTITGKFYLYGVS
jgi:hypothetical protein